VARLVRYPVKSMGGEDLTEARVGPRGLAGDRQWAVRTPDGGIGSGKTTRRFRRVDGLLDFRAELDGTVPVVAFPDGRRVRADDMAADEQLSASIGRPLALRPEGDVPHHDESPLHLIATSALDRLGEQLGCSVDADRFRANLVLETGDQRPGEAWEGRELRLGDDVVLRIGPGMPRCVMVDVPQRGLAGDGRILKELARTHDLEFGLQATVVRGGTLRVGDAARLG
jgi:hypothetical protein